MAGLFTDSDLARLLETNDASVLERPICGVHDEDADCPCVRVASSATPSN